MNCISCKIEISPSFIAAIKDNRCPACGQKCISDEDYGAIFNVVSSITNTIPELQEDLVIKIATAMHGKFDLFPKGVVVDGYITKEIVYVQTAAAGRMNSTRKAEYEEASRRAAPSRLSEEQLAKARSIASIIDEMEKEPEEDDEVGMLTNEDFRKMEADRLAQQMMERKRAAKAGIKP